MQTDTSTQLAGLTASTPDPEYVLYRLEEAGRTLLALPNKGPSTQLRTTRHDVVQSAVEAYGWTRVDARLRPAMPTAAQVTRMDEALDWIRLIPIDRYVLRRIVGARALISPITERHLFSWRRLGGLLGADHKAIQRWHGQGIDLIVSSLQGAGIAAATSAAASPWPRRRPECPVPSRPGEKDR